MKLYDIIFFSWTFIVIILLSVGLLEIKQQVLSGSFEKVSYAEKSDYSFNNHDILLTGLLKTNENLVSVSKNTDSQTSEEVKVEQYKKSFLFFSSVIWIFGIITIFFFKKVILKGHPERSS